MVSLPFIFKKQDISNFSNDDKDVGMGKPKMPMEQARINPEELLGLNLSNKSKTQEPVGRVSVTPIEFDMPIQNQERRATLNQNQQMDIDDDDTGLDSIESLVLFDRSRSIKPLTLKDFTFIQKLGNGSFGNVSLPDQFRYTLYVIRKQACSTR